MNADTTDTESPFYNNRIMGYAHHRLILDDKGIPVDFEFLDVNYTFEKITGLKRDDLIGRSVRQSIPAIEKSKFDWIGFYGSIALHGGDEVFEKYFEPLQKWFKGHVYSTEKNFLRRFLLILPKSEEKMRSWRVFYGKS
jgi:PAS domain-containing protein